MSSSKRLQVLNSHISGTQSAMASEKDAALAAVASDAPTIFDKIINKEIPANVVYEDDKFIFNYANKRRCFRIFTSDHGNIAPMSRYRFSVTKLFIVCCKNLSVLMFPCGRFLHSGTLLLKHQHTFC
ncbi:hypothetical protein R6Q57_002447 [Mikania cordata]